MQIDADDGQEMAQLADNRHRLIQTLQENDGNMIQDYGDIASQLQNQRLRTSSNIYDRELLSSFLTAEKMGSL